MTTGACSRERWTPLSSQEPPIGISSDTEVQAPVLVHREVSRDLDRCCDACHTAIEVGACRKSKKRPNADYSVVHIWSSRSSVLVMPSSQALPLSTASRIELGESLQS